MPFFSLNGSWRLSQADQSDAIPAQVPGCVHTDLLAAGKIPDPFIGTNELDVQWVSEPDWVYRHTFELPAHFLDHDRVVLRCAGLDTLAVLTLNGQEIGRANNMFRTWEFDVQPWLRPGVNEITVHFASALAYARQRQDNRFLPAWTADKYPGGNWLRKEPCNFGWDWGPRLVTCGIWRDIGLLAFDIARIADLRLAQEHRADGSVLVTCRLDLERLRPQPLTAHFSFGLSGAEQDAPQAAFDGDEAAVSFLIPDPQLWWPNGLGPRPLYTLRVTLVGGDGQQLDSASRRIGLRTLRLDRHPDEWGESFQFIANDVTFFAKGANWIPADTFLNRMTPERYAALLGDAAAANMNMLRVWGGGIYEEDIFYDLCDQLGICLWQDFIFSCATYPTFDGAWLGNVRQEVVDNVRRLRHHPSLALWCGNNELEQGLVGDDWTAATMSWEDYSRLFDRLLPELLSGLDPQRDYWPGSPHSPLGNRLDSNNPKWGDAHLWAVWHDKQPFEYYRTCRHRFNSEFGFQSFPEPRTVHLYAPPAERNLTSVVMEHHQRSGIGNQTILHYLLDWFRLPTSFDMLLWLSQVVQGMAMKYAVEHWRRTMPRGMGTLYWQLNDCWPVASWSSLDYFGRWKALHYMARHFYAPLLISGVEDLERGTANIHVSSDRLEPSSGRVSWLLTTSAGAPVAQDELDAPLPARQNRPVATLDLRPHLDRHGARDLLLWLSLDVTGEPLYTNLVLFARPKQIRLDEPEISADVVALDDGRYRLTVAARRPALWTWLTLDEDDARFSDNFVHLLPGRPLEITATSSAGLAGFRRQLRVHSLISTYR